MSEETRLYSEAEQERIKREWAKRLGKFFALAIGLIFVSGALGYFELGDRMRSAIDLGIFGGLCVGAYKWRRCPGCNSFVLFLDKRKSCPHCGVGFY